MNVTLQAIHTTHVASKQVNLLHSLKMCMLFQFSLIYSSLQLFFYIPAVTDVPSSVLLHLSHNAKFESDCICFISVAYYAKKRYSILFAKQPLTFNKHF